MRLLTLKSILVATDLSDASLSALRTAGRLGSLAGARIHLLHVADAHTKEDEDRLRDSYRRAAPDASEPATARVVPGSPASVIVEHAKRMHADAVILGPHRSSGNAQPMGSTAASVVRTAPCPCLVAATELRLPLERLVVPIDLSEITAGVLSVALSWASALRPRVAGAGLTALHIVQDDETSAADRAVHEEVQRARTRALGAARVEIREAVVRDSDPAERILRETASAPADLLVMGTHGAGGVASSLGSVSAAVTRATPCPLLLVPPLVWEENGVE